MGLAVAMRIDLAWAERQTPADLLATIIAAGEAQGEKWDYKQMRWTEKKK